MVGSLFPLKLNMLLVDVWRMRTFSQVVSFLDSPQD